MAQTVGDMTIEALKQLIDEAIDRRIEQIFGAFDMDFDDEEPADTRTLNEVYDSIERNRWTPPPGTPSVVDLLREDRDR